MREIVKLAAFAAVILIAAVLIALFASGYISAFKPGGTKETPGKHVTGGSSSITGGASVVSTPVPSPSPPPMPQLEEAMKQQQQPFPQNLPAQATPPLQEPIIPAFVEGPALPPVEPSKPSPAPPASWFDSRIIQDRPGTPPILGPTERPSPPVKPPASPEPSAPLSPFVQGWMQIIQRFVTILPYLFPGISPLQTWWPHGL